MGLPGIGLLIGIDIGIMMKISNPGAENQINP